ncbi:SurA N-terminal domain-containing protein [Thermodesulfobacteriota bacterium]
MLLSLMRKHAKSWLIKFLIGIIAIVFIFYFGYSFSAKEGVKIAEVNGEFISGLEYQKNFRELLKNLQNEYKSMWSENLIEVFDLKNRALEDLIDKKIISQEARKIGLDITDKEIQDKIIAFPAFQFRGRFDENRYKSLLANNRMKPEDFEATIAQDMLQQKLMQFLLTFLPVSGQEVLDQYKYSNQQVKIGFVQFSPEGFKDTIKIEEASMDEYFKEHKGEYRVPDKVKIVYITINPDEFKDQLKLEEKEIKEFYEDNQEMFKQEKQVNARHILFRLAPDASEDEQKKVKDKALSVLEKARAGQDFSELAKEYSEGPTKDRGGDLGSFPRGQMVKPFEDAVFKMKKNQISDLVKTSFGYHIIKVEDIKEEKTKDLEEVHGQISDILIGYESRDLANEKALSMIDQMPYDVDLIQYATQHDVPVGSTDYFSQDEPIPDLEGDQKLRQSIFSLKNKDVSELIEFKNRFHIIQVVDKKPSYLPDITEVSVRLKEDFTEYLAKLDAKSAAEKYLSELREGRDWDEFAKERDLKPEKTDFFTRLDFPPKIGYTPGLQEAAFKLNRDNRYHDSVFENEKGVFVIRWEEEKGIDEGKYKEERERYGNSLMLTKQQAIFMSWLERLKKNADIDRSLFEQYR